MVVRGRNLESLRDSAYQKGKISLETVCVYSSFIETKKKGEGTAYNGYKKRKGIKIHACVTSHGFPVAIIVSPGNEHDSKRFVEVMEQNKNQDRKKTKNKTIRGSGRFGL